MQRLPLDATRNTRDIGGWPIQGGGRVTAGQFIRSDLPYGLSARDIALLHAMNLTTVIDLRNDREVADRPCDLSGMPGIDYHHLPMGGEGRLPVDEDDVSRAYMEMAEDGQTMCRVFDLLAEAPGAALFHCTAGKDRTGVVAALLLALGGVALPDILADYQISESLLLPLIRRLAEGGIALHVLTPRPCYMERFLEDFYNRYGPVECYLEMIGLPPISVGVLKQKLAGA